ncbi:methyltransferase domain-containing protein [Microbacterium sp. NPDC076911]|uniref:methyltransferase domain-containing protein n=1 Tax=unclassified Microbacterium TaxID=2609290 RepID=UPI003429B4D4
MTARTRTTLSIRDEQLRELMDDPECDPERLRATLRRFHTVNRLISGWGTVYRSNLAPFLVGLRRPARVLDLGSGGGDIVLRLAALAETDGLDVEWVGADPDPRALRAANERPHPPGVTFRAADADDLLRGGERFDAVLSNHVLHHLDSVQIRDFADASAQLSTGIVLHSDIARSRAAYALYAVGITPLAPGTFLRTDGLRSIRRSFRRAELSRVLGKEWAVDTPSAFRLLASRLGHA